VAAAGLGWEAAILARDWSVEQREESIADALRLEAVAATRAEGPGSAVKRSAALVRRVAGLAIAAPSPEGLAIAAPSPEEPEIAVMPRAAPASARARGQGSRSVEFGAAADPLPESAAHDSSDRATAQRLAPWTVVAVETAIAWSSSSGRRDRARTDQRSQAAAVLS
jgi:hypothetical protein